MTHNQFGPHHPAQELAQPDRAAKTPYRMQQGQPPNLREAARCTGSLRSREVRLAARAYRIRLAKGRQPELSVIAMIGTVMQAGIVKKNAIMMVDFALERRRVGLSAEHASEAALLPFRPIMMTTFAAIFGTLPIVRLALGCASRSASQLSAVSAYRSF
jgi:hypothetical protein